MPHVSPLSVGRPLLTAEWRHLAMLNFDVDPAVLEPFVPRGTELDLWHGRALVSLVGFMFLKTRIWGLSIPGHRSFEELNLRFYVRRAGPEGWQRGVVFVKELVPRRAVAWIARTLYSENYHVVPMRHRIEMGGGPAKWRGVEYGWTFAGREHVLELRADAADANSCEPQPLEPGSEAEFIAEHYWGYTRQRNGSTLEYYVEHPPWRVWPVAESRLDCDAAALYGPEFSSAINNGPVSAVWAEGSEVRVYRGTALREC
jgi:hypothetical protein